MAAQRQLLLVEDEAAIAEPLVYLLEREGFGVRHVTLAREGLACLGGGAFDLLILDIGLPDGSGLEVLRTLRAAGATLPVMFLTARSDEVDRVVGLELGADDYVVKPFSPREVLARVRALLRRQPATLGIPAAGMLAAAAGQGADGAADVTPVWAHDGGALRIRYRGRLLELTRYEYHLLALLITQPGRIFTRADIMDRVWRDAPETADRTIDAHIKTLRAKLRQVDATADPIRTHRGLGYEVVVS